MASGELKALLAQYESLSINDRGKVHCDLTGHDMPARAADVLAYVNGSRFLMAQKRGIDDTFLESIKPWIAAHRRDPKKLYCTLTRHEINKIKDEVEAHMQGKRFQRLLAEAKEEAERKEKKAAARAAKKAGGAAADEDMADDDEDEDEDEEDEDADDSDADGQSEDVSDDDAVPVKSSKVPRAAGGIYVPSDEEDAAMDEDDDEDDDDAKEEAEEEAGADKEEEEEEAPAAGSKRKAEASTTVAKPSNNSWLQAAAVKSKPAAAPAAKGRAAPAAAAPVKASYGAGSGKVQQAKPAAKPSSGAGSSFNPKKARK